MATIQLETFDTLFRVSNDGSVVLGANGSTTDRVVIDAGVKNTNLTSTVEKVDFMGAISNYKFKKGFLNNIEIYDTNGVKLASWVADTGKSLVFADGSVPLNYANGIATIGGATIGSTIANVSNVVMDTSITSGGTQPITGTPTPTPTTSTFNISATGTTPLTSAADTINFSAGTYDATLIGFAKGDKLNLPDTYLSTLNLVNGSGTDGRIELQADDGTNVINIILTGIPASTDASIYNMSTFYSAFGSGSIA